MTVAGAEAAPAASVTDRGIGSSALLGWFILNFRKLKHLVEVEPASSKPAPYATHAKESASSGLSRFIGLGSESFEAAQMVKSYRGFGPRADLKLQKRPTCRCIYLNVDLICLTLKLSHDRAWRGACVSTIRDKHGHWL